MQTSQFYIFFYLRFLKKTLIVLYCTIVVIGSCLQSYFFGGYRLAVTLDLKYFSEVNSFLVWIVEYFIFISALWFLAGTMLYNVFYFIIFSNYITAQLGLITYYTTQLNLHDVRKLQEDLKHIFKLHLDVLR